MRLDDERESRNVDDRRNQSGGMSRSGLLLLWPIIRPLLRTKFGWLIIALGAILYISGYNPLPIIMGAGGNAARPVNHVKDDYEASFIKKVLASTEDVWAQVLPHYGHRYTPPVLVLYRGATHSGCGYARAQMGPFYCPSDQKIYLDLGFYDELARKYGASGDFAQAYVLAHEVGHHIQNLLGVLSKIHQIQKRAQSRGDRRKANRLQIPVELQADCYAGVWAHYARSHLEPGDIEEAINAASKIGDDTLQKQAQGYVVPDSFTHGTSKQRVKWFLVGFKSGRMEACNTFAGQ